MKRMIFGIGRKNRRGTLLAALLLLAAGGSGLASSHCMRAGCLPALPCQTGYQVVHTTPPVTAVSTAVVVLRSKAEADAASLGADKKYEVKFFQLDQAALAVDHCSISRVAIMLQSNGEWRVSL